VKPVKPYQIGIIALVMITISFIGCAEKLSFETVDKGFYGYDDIKKMKFVVIKTGEELNTFLYNHNMQEKIQLDESDEYIYIAAFQGLQSSAGYEIEIKDIKRDGETVTVKVKLRTPGSDEITADVLTSPYHIVKVKREALSGVKTFTFVDQYGRIKERIELE